jgi:hypothetical protein
MSMVVKRILDWYHFFFLFAFDYKKKKEKEERVMATRVEMPVYIV